jgi:hypothetical protein
MPVYRPRNTNAGLFVVALNETIVVKKAQMEVETPLF